MRTLKYIYIHIHNINLVFKSWLSSNETKNDNARDKRCNQCCFGVLVLTSTTLTML